MPTKESILSHLRRIKPELEYEGVQKLGLFGSFSKEKYDYGSDIDIVVATGERFLARHPDVHAFIYLEELREKLQMKFGRHVDICDAAGLKDPSVLESAVYV